MYSIYNVCFSAILCICSIYSHIYIYVDNIYIYMHLGESSLNEERTTGDLENWAREGCSLPSQIERKQP